MPAADAAIRVAVVEDEPLYLSLLRTLLSLTRDIEVVATAVDSSEASDIDPDGVDVAVLDVGLGEIRTGIDIATGWQQRNPELSVVLLTDYANPRLLDRLPTRMGLRWSYLLKTSVSDVHALVQVIRSTHNGHRVIDPHVSRGRPMRPGSLFEPLSHKQLRVLQAVASGASNAQIAADMEMSVKGVESLLRRTLPQIGIDTDNRSINPRVAATLAVVTGLVPSTDLVTDNPIGDRELLNVS